MRRVPILATGNALLQIVRTAANTFSTELQRCQIGSRNYLPRTAAQLAASLPAVVATLGDIDLQDSDQVHAYLEQGIPWDLNLLAPIPETGDAAEAFLVDQETLVQLFSGAFQDLTLSGVSNVEISEVVPVGIFQHDELQELDEPLDIAWARVRVLVRLHSWEQ